MDGIFNKSSKFGKEYFRNHYLKNREKYLLKAKNWQQKNKDRVNLNIKILRDKLRGMVFDKLGKKCVKCGFSDIRALQIDHVNGGGKKEYESINNIRTLYKKILNDKNGNYQILCANCNWIKRHENFECKKK